jgi:hypothetical protein
MKPPASLDPDMLTVVEILQHASEIVSRMPLSVLKVHLQQVAPDDPALPWYEAVRRLVESAQSLELDGGKLAALEARTEVKIDTDAINRELPDDWTMG